MDNIIENLTLTELKKTFKRLQKDTKNFSKLIVRDPLDFLDFKVHLEKNLNSLIFEINSQRYHPVRPYLHLSAKGKGINRPTVVFDIKDALVYRFCIEQIGDELFKKTRNNPNIRGGVKLTASKNAEGDDYYEKWFDIWTEHQNDLEKTLKNKKFLALSDIASYFENINILLLKDLVRGDITGKNGILNLLFYFLENCRFRHCYEYNTYIGLPQEDIDCSRTLAYYFLKSHDDAMTRFCIDYDCEFYRFVDDMAFAVNSEIDAKKALKESTESLRRLNLVASIEKTIILSRKQAQKELLFQENKNITVFQTKILNQVKGGRQLNDKTLIPKLKKYYKQLQKNKIDKLKNWTKLLKRFYSLCTYSRADFLLDDIGKHIIEYPIIFAGNRLGRYLLRIRQNKRKLNNCIKSLISYLNSAENLYPELESNLLETILLLDKENLYESNLLKINLLSEKIFFSQDTAGLSEYSRSLSCLLIYRFHNNNTIEKLAGHYIKSDENDYLLKKYLLLVALTVNNHELRKQTLDKAKKEQNSSINRIANFIENIDSNKDNSVVKKYIENNMLYIYIDREHDIEIVEQYNPVRIDILKNIIKIYSPSI